MIWSPGETLPVAGKRSAATPTFSDVTGGQSEAVRAFWRGENTKVLDILENASISPKGRVDAELLRARTLMRMRRFDEAQSALEGIPSVGLSEDHRVAREMLRASVQFRKGRRELAISALNGLHDKVSLAPARVHPTVKAEVAYFYALALWSERRLQEAETVASFALDRSTDIVYVRLLELLGWIAMSRADVPSAARYFSTGIAEFRSCKHQDQSVIAGLLHGATIIAIETLDAQLLHLVRGMIDEVHWSESDQWRRAQIETYLGRLAELEGRASEAWRRFDLAKSLDVSVPYKALAMIAQANLLSHVGEQFASTCILGDVWRTLSSVVWSKANAEERIALVAYAFAAAPTDQVSASQALTRARSIWEKDDPLIALSRDNRIEALLAQASGAIHISCGNTKLGIRELKVAYNIWCQYGFRLLSGTLARLLWDLTRETEYRSHLDELARRLPQAWFVRHTNSGEHTEALAQLSPTERRVLDEILRGKRSKEIAVHFGRSVFTIRNQTKNIFNAFGVHSRAALIAMCAQSNSVHPSTKNCSGLEGPVPRFPPRRRSTQKQKLRKIR